ncbi:MAG: hypothetical protein EB084_07485 [Proteobacteria bacterium]|nr:hypothetical protein [Pseudomonadota bacterium]
MTATTPTTKCKICGLFDSRMACTACQKQVCNIHACDVCRRCSKDCVCWQAPHSVYHPPVDEPPAR